MAEAPRSHWDYPAQTLGFLWLTQPVSLKLDLLEVHGVDFCAGWTLKKAPLPPWNVVSAVLVAVGEPQRWRLDSQIIAPSPRAWTLRGKVLPAPSEATFSQTLPGPEE